jgi:hypothetical protein
MCNNKVFIYGGQKYSENKSFGDAFLYDIGKITSINHERLETNTWETLTNKDKPIDRNSCSVCYDKRNNRVILIGGANSDGPLDDVHVYHIGKLLYIPSSD